MILSEIKSVISCRWKYGVLSFIIVFFTGFIFHIVRPDMYEARLTLAVEQPSQDIFTITQSGAMPARFLSLYTRASRIKTRTFAKKVAKDINNYTLHNNPVSNDIINKTVPPIQENEVFQSIHVFTKENPDLFFITALHKDSRLGSMIVKSTAELFIREREEAARREAKGARIQLEKRIEEIKDAIKKDKNLEDPQLFQALKIKLEELKLIEKTKPPDVVLLDEVPEIKKLTQSLGQKTLFLFWFGFIMAFTTILFAEAVDSKIARLGALRAVSPETPSWKISKNLYLEPVVQAIRFWYAKEIYINEIYKSLGNKSINKDEMNKSIINKGKIILIASLNEHKNTANPNKATVNSNNIASHKCNNQLISALAKLVSNPVSSFLKEVLILEANDCEINNLKTGNISLAALKPDPFQLIFLNAVSVNNDGTAYFLGKNTDGILLILEAGILSKENLNEEMKRWKEIKTPIIGILLVENCGR